VAGDPRIVITFNTQTGRVEMEWPDGNNWALIDHMMAEAARLQFETWLAERKQGGGAITAPPPGFRT